MALAHKEGDGKAAGVKPPETLPPAAETFSRAPQPAEQAGERQVAALAKIDEMKAVASGQMDAASWNTLAALSRQLTELAENGARREEACLTQLELLNRIRINFNELKRIYQSGLPADKYDTVTDLALGIGECVTKSLASGRTTDSLEAKRIAAVQHDLKGPTQVFVGAMDLLRNDPSPTDRTLILSEFGLTVSRFEMLLSFQEGREKPIVFNLFDELAPEIRATARAYCAPKIEGNRPNIFAGRVAMWRVFKNLIRNADEAGAREAVVKFDGPIVTVKDNGRGMGPEVLARVRKILCEPVDPYAPLFSSGKEHGTGFGLRTVREQLDKVGATVKVESAVGEGTTFTIDFTNSAAQAELLLGARAKFEEIKKLADTEHIDADSAVRISTLADELVNVFEGALKKAREAAAKTQGIEDPEKAKGIEVDRVALIGHDLRGPLAVIMGYADILRLYPDVENAKDAIKTAIKEYENILRYEEGLEAPTVFSIQEMLQARVPGEVRSVSFAGKSFSVKAGENSMIRIFKNLVRNAHQAGASEVQVIFSEDTPGHVLVKDNGKGMPPEVLAKLFQPYNTFGKEGGTGLGLVIIKEKMDETGAKISVKSKEGEGTTFDLDFTSCLAREAPPE